ncbi:MAG: glycine cleavage system aminomethyltransferase GcvT [Nitrospinaceae bacterium]|nr:glycine cleavage system aminomethyltransferase GcvT [Nitrospina sp.]MBT5027896.1 glycine cleavage system aminomethyltransferase GcvT [Nitrospina sp.]MBT5376539.1 glycine cleavage system aminomethyltransferase GcvT [Nitrospinaceae bacterium]MBT5867411.1 glycine cleavage system aminomethyltransferase GcvT [Nitrospinaceae bacterium]MBT6345751.1 glycine cleavage system aminomethyltransferase GcvT [Nitrospina sp.]
MSQETSTNLKRTPVNAIHKELGGKLVPFAGWEMPIQFQGVIQEHQSVREGVGIFDVSHMGEIEIQGPSAKKLIQHLVTNDIESMQDNQALYTLMCLENGGVVDDLLVHRFSDDHYFLCVNASNSDKDFQWIMQNAGSYDATIRNTSQNTAQFAIQGKHSVALLQKICDTSLDEIEYYHFKKAKIHQFESIIARTGYTGEDGFEVYIDADHAEAVFRAILDAGKEFDLQPIGLGARDTLRMEMGYALYGNEINETSKPFEAGLGWVIKLGKEDFIGKAELKKQKLAGNKRKLVGIRLLGRGVLRPHYRILKNGAPVGELTSGTFSPSLNTGIGLCYVSTECAEPGTQLEVEIRKLKVPAEVVKPPFLPTRVKKING